MPILNRAAEMQPEIAEWRRHLHSHPELLFDVHQTAEFVEGKLKVVEDVVEGLENALAVRRAVLARFSRGVLHRGRPLGELEEVLAPLYFHHRFQVDAAAKLVAGVDYDHAVHEGDGPAPGRVVAIAPAADAQRRAS